MKWHKFPPLTSLRAFEAAARTGSFSEAGRELNVSHAAIAQQVRALETYLSERLTKRNGRGIQVTDKGAILYESLKSGFNQILEGLEEFNDEDHPILISMTPGFSASWFMPRMQSLKTEYPDIDLTIHPTSELVDLSQGEYDLAIRFGDGDWSGLESELLLSSDYVIVGAPSLVGERWTGSKEELRQMPWLQEVGTNEVMYWLEESSIEAPRPKHITNLPGYMIMKPLLDGVGVTAIARALIEEFIADGRLVVMATDSTLNDKNGYHIVWRKGVQRQPVKDLIKWLRKMGKEEHSSLLVTTNQIL